VAAAAIFAAFAKLSLQLKPAIKCLHCDVVKIPVSELAKAAWMIYKKFQHNKICVIMLLFFNSFTSSKTRPLPQ
jgi:hypothetical protein